MKPFKPKLPEGVRDALWELLDHYYEDERAHFYGAAPEDRKGHIFASLLVLRLWLHVADHDPKDQR